MEKIKMLVFDIDGTLVDRSKQTVEESAVDAINKARELGYEILIATGRSFFFIHDDVKKQINTDYYVTVNGACLNNHKGEIIQAYPFDLDSLETLITYCEENNYQLGIKYNDFIGVYGDVEAFMKRYIGLNHPKANYIIDDNKKKLFTDNQPLGVYYYAPYDTLNEVKELIPTLTFIPDGNGAIEAIAKGVDKTKNIEDVLAKLNLSWDNVISFGDGNNDIKMLELAKVGVAMGNSTDTVKASADFVAEHILEDGIIKALKHLQII